ncbi:MAG: sensor histidine kinase [Myxococcota bacterium]
MSRRVSVRSYAVWGSAVLLAGSSLTWGQAESSPGAVVEIAAAETEEELVREAVRIAEPQAEVSRLIAQRQRILLALAGTTILSFVLIPVTLAWHGRARRQAHRELSQARDRVEAQDGKLAEAVGQREALLRELNHRVKNNLQVIASLLGLERRRAEAEGANVECLRSVQARVISMASIHEGLPNRGSADDVRLDDYLGRLAERLANVYGHRCHISLGALPSRTVALADAAPIGLIICELVSNAVRHAYAEEDDVHVTISLASTPEGTALQISDKGCGVRDDERRLEPTGSLGLALVYDLARQVGAKISWSHNQPRGLVWTLELAR